jgi:hypothetical protein
MVSTRLLVITSFLAFYFSGCESMSASYYGWKYCSKEPNPKTWIGEKVEAPISIYWEENIYPGYDDKDAKLMMNNYLDGVRLQKMALNTPDGKVKVYYYEELPESYIDLVKKGYEIADEWIRRKKASNKAFDIAYDSSNSKYRDGYSRNSSPLKEISAAFRKIDAEKTSITKEIKSEKATLKLVITESSKATMPLMNYTVKTDEVQLSDSAREVIYSYETKVIDNRKEKVIGYNRGIRRLYSANLIPDFAGGRYFTTSPLCGKGTDAFETYIFFKSGTWGSNRATSLNNKLYKRYNKYEETQ